MIRLRWKDRLRVTGVALAAMLACLAHPAMAQSSAAPPPPPSIVLPSTGAPAVVPPPASQQGAAAAQTPPAGAPSAGAPSAETLPAETEPPKPTVQSIGRSGPTQYERNDLKIYGVDDRIRRLGETNYKAGQEDTPLPNSGRNCGRFNTTIVCD